MFNLICFIMWSIKSIVLPTRVFSDMKSVAPIDQYDAQEFNINECGVIRNDISKLARAQSQSEFDSIMRKIGQNKAVFNIKDGQKLQEVFDSIRPRQLQTPSELAGFAEYMARLDQAYADVHVPDVNDSSKVVSDTPVPDSSES